MNGFTSRLRSTLPGIWTVLSRLGVDTYVRRGYFTLQAAPRGWRYRVRVGDNVADMATTNWIEYKRAKYCHGERAVIERFLDDLDGEPDAVFWDVGANVGLYSCLAAAALPEGTVVAFEPEEVNRTRLEENFAANDPTCEWTVSPVALSDRDGDGRLAAGFDEEHCLAGTGHYYLSETEGRPVDRRRAETLIQDGYPVPDVVKIDVQGAELDVLRGFGDAIHEVERFYVELHTEKARRYDATVEETEAFLRDAGFSVSHLGEPSGYRHGVYHVRAVRDP